MKYQLLINVFSFNYYTLINFANSSHCYINNNIENVSLLVFNSMIKRELARQNQLLQRILDKDTNVYMDGNKVGTQLALSNPRMQ